MICTLKWDNCKSIHTIHFRWLRNSIPWQNFQVSLYFFVQNCARKKTSMEQCLRETNDGQPVDGWCNNLKHRKCLCVCIIWTTINFMMDLCLSLWEQCSDYEKQFTLGSQMCSEMYHYKTAVKAKEIEPNLTNSTYFWSL